VFSVVKSAFNGALFFALPTTSRCIGTFDAHEGAQPIVLSRTKDSLVFRRVHGILVSNDASAHATICRAVP
jgi:hypothetical protein